MTPIFSYRELNLKEVEKRFNLVKRTTEKISLFGGEDPFTFEHADWIKAIPKIRTIYERENPDLIILTSEPHITDSPGREFNLRLALYQEKHL